jgi:predicted secreted hydrolase
LEYVQYTSLHHWLALFRRRLPLLLAMVALLVGLGVLRWLIDDPPEPHAVTAILALGAAELPAEGFPPPGEGPLVLPRDHGAKPDQLAEYWLFAGSLAAGDGRQYGFQLALLRVALQAEKPVRESAWATRDVYRGHLVITAADTEARASERYSRAVLGLSGAANEPMRVWLDNWRVEYDEVAKAFRLQASDTDHGLDLELSLPPDEPLALEGSGYRGYWLSGLAAEGELTLSGRSIPTSGRALVDRLWGRTLPIGRGQLALSRLWLELDDGSALRCMQLRRRADGGTPIGECLLHRPNGTSERFEGDRLSLEPVGNGWRKLAGVHYPLHWNLQLADHGAGLRITPLVDEQGVFAGSVWSGTVRVDGHWTGWGLLELSNYAAR